MDYWAKDIYSWGIFSAEVYPRSSIAIQRTVSDVVNFLSTQWSTDGSTTSEPMGLCITSIVKTLTDNHTLDDRNHQGHHTTLLLSESLFSTAQASLCVGEVRSLESTGSPCEEFWSQISTCILPGYRLNKSLHLTPWGSQWSCGSKFATRLTLCQTLLTMFGFRTRNIFRCQVTWTLRTTSSGVVHPWALSAKAITLCEVHCMGCHPQTWHHWTILVRGRQRTVCDNQHRGICPGAWQVLDSTWSTERGCQGPPVVPAGWCHPHTSNKSLAWLQQRFPDRLISRRCDPQWSPHPPTWTSQIFISGDN